MAKSNVTVTVTAGDVTYTATLVRRGEWPVAVEGTDGSRWAAEWEPEFQYMVSDEERTFSDTVKEQIEAAIIEALAAESKARWLNR